MTNVAGIQIERDSKGRPAFARFNLKKYPEALELLKKLGACEQDEDWEKALTPDEFMDEVKSLLKHKEALKTALE